jgi:hypothetical protein
MRVQEIDAVTEELEDEFQDLVDQDTLRAVVEARAHRFDSAPVQDFVPLLVERQVREALKRMS